MDHKCSHIMSVQMFSRNGLLFLGLYNCTLLFFWFYIFYSEVPCFCGSKHPVFNIIFVRLIFLYLFNLLEYIFNILRLLLMLEPISSFWNMSMLQVVNTVAYIFFYWFCEQRIKLDSSLLACGDLKLKWNILRQPTTLITLQASFNFIHSHITVKSRF